MKELYYAGHQLRGDLVMCKLLEELEGRDDVIILSHGRNTLIHEMEYINNYSTDRRDTGKTHVGFEYAYITFYYSGATYHINLDDFSGPEIHKCSLKDGWYETQETYPQRYRGFDNINKINDFIPTRTQKTLPIHSIPFYVQKSDFECILKDEGGNREREIYACPHICYDIEDTEDHRIVKCEKITREDDGVRLSFAIDMKTKKIIG